MKLKGSVHIFGDNIDTDVIIPARYLNTTDPGVLAAHCMEDVDKDFMNRLTVGDIIVAGENFGCGSSREHAPLAIKTAGVSCVIARSFARIFYRNAINIGLPILECDALFQETSPGDSLSVDLDAGMIENLTTKKQYKAVPFPPFIMSIIKAGGLLKSIQ